MTTRERPKPASLRALIERDDARVRYDVERGLARHRELIARGAELPEWARDMPRPRRGVLRYWVAGALLLGGTFVATRSSTTHDEVVAMHTPSVADVRAVPTPTVTPLASEGTQTDMAARSSAQAPAPAPIVESLAPHANALEIAGGEEASAPSASAAGTSASASKARGDTLPTPISRGAVRRVAHGRTLEGASTPLGTKSATRGNVDAPLDAEEIRQLEEAERMLPIDPLHTLKLARAGELAFKTGYFSQERRYLEIMSLFALGRSDEARARAEWFLRDYPEGPYRRKVELAQLRHAHR